MKFQALGVGVTVNDRMEREIDELLARLGVGESRRIEEPVAPTRSPGADIRRQFPGSPIRLMVLSILLGVCAFLLPALSRPIVLVAIALLLVGYLTWLFEPNPPSPDQPPGWFARFYHRLYGE